MNILFDFIPFQHAQGIGGHASFTKTILDELLRRRGGDTHIFAATDSGMPDCKAYDISQLCTDNAITTVDLAKEPLCDVIREKHIDLLFIAIGQLYAKYDLQGISCKTILFIHDIFDVERYHSKLDVMLYDRYKDSLWTQAKRMMNLYGGRWKRQMRKCYDSLMPLYNAPTTIAYTVSEYSRQALRYYFPETDKDIRVCYSPLKITKRKDTIENPTLRSLIESGKPYLFMVAANRRYKNPVTVIKACKRLWLEGNETVLLTLRYGHSVDPSHIDIDFLSDSDMENAYKYAKALLFPSFCEGFGYPPVEAMKYGTPTIASNVTSIPEIVGNAGFYFSPFSPPDLYRTIKDVLSTRNMKREQMAIRYQAITQRQEKDLQQLMEEFFEMKDEK
jgi:glycosyltransferase involved in cell wall biosynthesis